MLAPGIRYVTHMGVAWPKWPHGVNVEAYGAKLGLQTRGSEPPTLPSKHRTIQPHLFPVLIKLSNSDHHGLPGAP